MTPPLPLCVATNLDLDDELLNQARDLGGHRTKREAANTALRAYVDGLRKRDALVSLLGEIEFDSAYDYKAARSRPPR